MQPPNPKKILQYVTFKLHLFYGKGPGGNPVQKLFRGVPFTAANQGAGQNIQGHRNN